MKIKVHGAAEEVTGSCIQITTEQSNIIVDCGLIQGAPKREERNRAPFPFSLRDLDTVILTHAHIDHSGRLPVLVSQGYEGPIHTHEANADLLDILLMDSAYLQEKEAEWANKKRDRKGLKLVDALYTQDDVPPVLSLLNLHPYSKPIQITEDITLVLHNAGHILGSAHVELLVKENSHTKRIIISGDIGNPGSPIQEDSNIYGKADLVIMESTYGNRNHQSWDASILELKEAINKAHHDGGNVLIPSFAVGRTQILLYYFAKYYKEWNLGDWDIYLDSPMAIKVTNTYGKYWQLYKKESQYLWSGDTLQQKLPNLKFTPDTEQSIELNSVHKGAIIIAGSGMMNGGRIKQHLKHNIWRPQCTLIVAGFQPEGTLGSRIVEGAPYIKLWGETVKVAASVYTIGGFSAHAGQQELLRWYQKFENSPRLVLVHGAKTTMEEFHSFMTQNVDSEVTIAKQGEVIRV
ncbi:MBL fold metallo-hydrolase RNA specificity domain-containing protein [Kangiella sp. M94]